MLKAAVAALMASSGRHKQIKMNRMDWNGQIKEKKKIQKEKQQERLSSEFHFSLKR